MDINKIKDYWLEGYKDALLTSEKLFEAKRYHHCLFFGHLALEKLLKAVVVDKTENHALAIHDLVKLAEQAGLKFSKRLLEDLTEINKFNLEARYDSYKLVFYKTATRVYTVKWRLKIKEMALWLEEKLNQK